MLDMQNKSIQIAQAYLNRRHRFFEHCHIPPLLTQEGHFAPTLRDASKQSQNNLQLQHSEEQSEPTNRQPMRNWVIAFGEALLNDQIDLRAIKKLGHEIRQCEKEGNQLLNMEILQFLRLAHSFQPVSKISNTILSLSQKSSYLRKLLLKSPASFIVKTAKYLAQNSAVLESSNCLNSQQNICSTPLKSGKVSYEDFLLLTDLFVFGIHLSSHEFVNIVSILFETDCVHSRKYLFDGFQSVKGCDTPEPLHYISHYSSILLNPQILNRRNREKIMTTFKYYLQQKVIKQMLPERANQMLESLNKLKEYYTQTKAKSIRQDKGAESKEQSSYILAFHRFYKLALETASALNLLIDILGGNTTSMTIHELLSFSQQNTKKLEVCNNPIGELSQLLYYLQVSLIKNKASNTSSMNKIMEPHSILHYALHLYCQTSLKDKSEDDENEDVEQQEVIEEAAQTSQQQKQREISDHLLNEVYKNCSFYCRKNWFVQDQVYILADSSYFQKQTTSNKLLFHNEDQPRAITPNLSDSANSSSIQFIQKLINCSNETDADKLAKLFLQSFNKHDNRMYLVRETFQRHARRNNLPYLVRVIASIAIQQSKQLKEAIRQEINKIGHQDRYKSESQSYWDKPQYLVVVELIKFGMIDGRDMLSTIAHDCRCNGLNVSTLITLLEKLDRKTYFYSLDIHGLFNEIIDAVYEHIKKRQVGYQVEMINRFNSLVSYLRLSGEQYQLQDDDSLRVQWRDIGQHEKNLANIKITGIIELEDLKSDKSKLQTTVKLIKKYFLPSKTIKAAFMKLLIRSIEKQSYIETYQYADLVYQINDRWVDSRILDQSEQKIIYYIGKGDLQAATNWSRFYGQLFISKVISNGSGVQRIARFIMNELLRCNDPAMWKKLGGKAQTRDSSHKQKDIQQDNIKILLTQDISKPICAIFQATHRTIIRDCTRQEMNLFIYILIVWKQAIIQKHGLSNQILEQQVADIMEAFHPILVKNFKNVQEIQEFICRLSKDQEQVPKRRDKGKYKKQEHYQLINLEKMLNQMEEKIQVEPKPQKRMDISQTSSSVKYLPSNSTANGPNSANKFKEKNPETGKKDKFKMKIQDKTEDKPINQGYYYPVQSYNYEFNPNYYGQHEFTEGYYDYNSYQYYGYSIDYQKPNQLTDNISTTLSPQNSSEIYSEGPLRTNSEQTVNPIQAPMNRTISQPCTSGPPKKTIKVIGRSKGTKKLTEITVAVQ